MIDYLTYYYNIDNEPFRSLTDLADEEAINIMNKLRDDSFFGERFKNPAQYLKSRKATEAWVRKAFIAKGGKPKDKTPISMVLGSSKWLVSAAPDPEKHGEIRIPLSIFMPYDISFTYPDSMLSRWISKEKPPELFQPDLHGKVFTINEIISIVENKGMPEEDWEIQLPERLAPYIEAQVWNRELLFTHKRKIRT